MWTVATLAAPAQMVMVMVVMVLVVVHDTVFKFNSVLSAIDVIVVGLRKKLKPVSADIETVRGIGYRVESHEI